MSLAELSPLANHLWQSTLFVAVVGLLAFSLRSNRAQVRYWLWLFASMKFLVPFAALVAVGRQFGWQSSSTIVQPAMTFVIDAIGQPFAQAALATIPSSATTSALVVAFPILLLATWFCGCAMHLLAWWVRWHGVAVVARAASPLEDGRALETLRRLEGLIGIRQPIAVVTSDASLEPGVFGIFKPVLVWPRSIAERLVEQQREAIFAHELCHVRRRDNLAAAFHMLVEAMFWFHPLVWWLEKRLIDERERACDEEVIRLGSEPQVYAESILKTCEFYVESPLACVSGVTGSDLKRRVEAIMRSHGGKRLNAWQKAVLTTAGIVAVASPVVVGALNGPRLQAQLPPFVAESPAFEVASIKPNRSGDLTRMEPQPGGRITVVNAPLRLLIRLAYRVQDFQIIGGPGWLNTDRFDVVAKAEGNPTQAELLPMVRRLLADRFKLQTHNETRELPIYALVMAKDDRKPGPNLRQAEPCFQTPGNAPPQSPPLFGPAPCGFTVGPGRWSARGVTMGALAASLSNQFTRVVLDRTQLSGQFDMNLQWELPATASPDTALPSSDGPSIFTALQEQLGLKLEPTRGPVDVLVVDRVEHPGPD